MSLHRGFNQKLVEATAKQPKGFKARNELNMGGKNVSA